MLPIVSTIAEDRRHHRIAVDRHRVAFMLILAFAASLRLFHLTAPITDLHAWRQLDTLAMARNFYEGSFWPFDPGELGRPPWLPRSGVSTHSCVDRCGLQDRRTPRNRRTPHHHRVLPRARMGDLQARADPGREAFGGERGRLPDGRFAGCDFFGRIVIPDTPMVFFTVLALIGFAEFSRSGSVRWMVTGASALTIACLLKLPAVFVGPAIVALLVRQRGWSAFRDPRVWLAGVIPLAITAAWYWRAHVVFERTGLTMGILGRRRKYIRPTSVPGPGRWCSRSGARRRFCSIPVFTRGCSCASITPCSCRSDSLARCSVHSCGRRRDGVR